MSIQFNQLQATPNVIPLEDEFPGEVEDPNAEKDGNLMSI
jgi:hypothetical protein